MPQIRQSPCNTGTPSQPWPTSLKVPAVHATPFAAKKLWILSFLAMSPSDLELLRLLPTNLRLRSDDQWDDIKGCLFVSRISANAPSNNKLQLFVPVSAASHCPFILLRIAPGTQVIVIASQGKPSESSFCWDALGTQWLLLLWKPSSMRTSTWQPPPLMQTAAIW